MKRLLLIVTLLTAIQFVQAQDKIKASEKLQIQKVASVVLKDIHTDFNPQLLPLEMPAPGSESYRRHLIDLKEALYGNGKYIPTARNNNTNLSARGSYNTLGSNLLYAFPSVSQNADNETEYKKLPSLL